MRFLYLDTLMVAIHYSRITMKQIFRWKNVFQRNQSMNNEQPSTHYLLFVQMKIVSLQAENEYSLSVS